MDLATAIKTGITQATKQWRFTTLVYVVQLLFVLLLSLQVFQVLEASIGNSLQINALAKGYNHTVLTDFIKVHGASLTPLLGQLRWFLLIWLVLSSFLQGGLLSRAVTNTEAGIGSYFVDCAKYFSTFLYINLSGLVLALLSGAVLVGSVVIQFQSLIERFESEKSFLALLGAAIVIWLFLVLFIYVWVLLAKLTIVTKGVSMWSGVVQAWPKLKASAGIYLLIAVGAVCMALLFWYVFQWLAGPDYWSKPGTMLLLTLLQQVFVWLRIWLRQVVYGAYHVVLRQ